MPYVGVRTAAVILAAAPDISQLRNADHFIAYAGLNPVTRQSGTSLRGERPNRGGHRQLRNALWNSASISLTGHAESKVFNDRRTKIEKKKHGAAVMALARRRARVIYALMRDGVEYQEPGRAA